MLEKKINILDVALLCMLFFTTYVSVPMFVVPALILVSLSLVLTSRSHRVFDISTIAYFIFLIIFFIVSAFIYNNNSTPNYNPNGFGIIYLRLSLSVLLGLLIFVFSSNYDCRFRLLLALEKVIVIHMLFFLIQAMFQLFLDIKLDPLVYLTGEGQRNLSTLGGFTLYRFSGFFNEPGTYGHVMAIMLTLYYLAKGRVNNIFNIGLLTVLLTFSLSTYVVVIPLIFISFYSLYLKNKLKAYLIFFPSIFIALYNIGLYAYLYISGRFLQREDYSLNQKVESLNDFIHIDIVNLFFGYGFSFRHLPDFYLIDSGVLINTIYSMGLIFVILVLMFQYLGMNRNIKMLCLVMYPLVFIKLDLHYQIFWFYIFSCCAFSFRVKNEI